MNLPEIDTELTILRNEIPEQEKLLDAKRLICQAQNIIQKHIEKYFPPSEWQHTKTEAPVKSSYNLTPTNE